MDGVLWVENVPVAPDSQGRFKVENVYFQDYKLIISGLARGFYVNEIRHNSSVLHGNILSFASGALRQSIEIVTDNKPAELDGSVMDGEHAVPDAYVALLRWPMPSQTEMWPLNTTTTDSDGKYQFAGIKPGDYRVLAVPSILKDGLEDPQMLRQLLSQAKAVVLPPSGYATQDVPITQQR
jgi:hypothetical protein